jgi:LmbE family N-acetylglucosaminyl deacetylase
MAKAAHDGHRVVLVTATRGECGEVAEGFLDEGEQLGDRREVELAEAAKVLGVSRLEILGYHDSGMMGTPENDAPNSFWNADVEEAAQKLAAILLEENVDVMTMYDENGVYGHPDHIKVWEVGARAAAIAGTKKVYEGTINRTAWMRRVAETGGATRRVETVDGVDQLIEVDAGAADQHTIEFPLGVDESELTTAIDVRDYIDVKKQAMRVHASQITEESFFLKMSDEDFASGFGTEWFILRGEPKGVHEYDLFAGIAQ